MPMLDCCECGRSVGSFSYSDLEEMPTEDGVFLVYCSECEETANDIFGKGEV